MNVQTNILPPRYRNPERIGQGGMGEIYRAEDELLGRTVAIKMLADRYAADAAVRGRFTREALAAARLSGQPNTVTIFDVGEHDERPFIVMEYLRGGSLEDRLREHGAQDPARALAWLEQAAAALDAAHENGVVHRDVKPGNLLLAADGTVRVADFGVASAAGLDSLTVTGTVLGTAGYLAPEQARGEPTTPAADRYALAVVAFELLTGNRPYEADSPTAEAAAHVHAEVPSVCDRLPDLPCELDPVFQRALAKDPAERYPTCADFVAALREALADAASTTRELAPLPVTAPAPVAARRVPGAAVVIGLLLLAALLAGIGVAAALTGGDEGQEAAPQTVTRQVVTTVQGEATTETIVTTAPSTTQPAPPPPPPPPAPSGASGRALTDQATALLAEGRWSEAEGVARQAVQKLDGSGDNTYLAYALYDLGRALAEQGKCEEAVGHLNRSEELQGYRQPIADARAKCQGGGDD
jgi:tRNA A-37 threonylcarbamoyl transferase component Bud32